jgi:magnesium-dependent phosphatase 1
MVFDLDYTLWPFWVDTHVTPPIKTAPNSNHSAALDRHGESFAFYSDVPVVLHSLRAAKVKIGAASRTHAPELGREMLRLLQIPTPQLQHEWGDKELKEKVKDSAPKRALDFFDYTEIYPGSKTTHFQRIKKSSGIEYEDMLFFDDEGRNRNVETELGVLFWLVRDGVSRGEIDNAVWEWRKRRGHGGRKKMDLDE